MGRIANHMANRHFPITNGEWCGGIPGLAGSRKSCHHEIVLHRGMTEHWICQADVQEIAKSAGRAVIDIQANARPAKIRSDGEDAAGMKKIVLSLLDVGGEAGEMSNPGGIRLGEVNGTLINMHGLACHKRNFRLDIGEYSMGWETLIMQTEENRKRKNILERKSVFATSQSFRA
jgi:hypothetical protein